jgi:catechol 2,3-dioxygenase-like lactoylglutathione lyase family enzyme
MKILGIDRIVLGVDEMTEAQRFLTDFGLEETESGREGASFATQDGTELVLRHAKDSALQPAVGPEATAREIIWGVESAAELDRIAAELGRDRNVVLEAGGLLRTIDDSGFGVGFQVSQRKAFGATPALANAHGLPPQRPRNVRADLTGPVRPRGLGHIVLFVNNLEAAERFYTERLGFRVSDRFRGRGVFLRAAGSHDHHTLFLIQRPDQPGGLHHIECHVSDFNEVMRGGASLSRKGWATQHGPGRHILGSNYFWYFRAPFGGALELGADMDWVDDDWQAGEWDLSPEMTAAWTATFDSREIPPGGPG